MDKHKKNHAHEGPKQKQPEDVVNSANHVAKESSPAANDALKSHEAEKECPPGAEQECDLDKAHKDIEIKKLKEEMDSLKDLMQRRQADFENYKKRQLKMQQDQNKLAIKDLALDILTIHDDLIRAMEAAANIQKDTSLESGHASLVDGVTMISKRIEETLKKYGIVEIDSLNQAFDPNLNEAVEIEMSEHVDKDTVTKVYQKGFRFDDLVLRHTRVRVAKPVKSQGSAMASQGDAQGACDGQSESQDKS